MQNKAIRRVGWVFNPTYPLCHFFMHSTMAYFFEWVLQKSLCQVGWCIKKRMPHGIRFSVNKPYTTASSFFFCGLAKLSRSRPNIISRGLATSTDE